MVGQEGGIIHRPRQTASREVRIRPAQLPALGPLVGPLGLNTIRNPRARSIVDIVGNLDSRIKPIKNVFSTPNSATAWINNWARKHPGQQPPYYVTLEDYDGDNDRDDVVIRRTLDNQPVYVNGYSLQFQKQSRKKGKPLARLQYYETFPEPTLRKANKFAPMYTAFKDSQPITSLYRYWTKLATNAFVASGFKYRKGIDLQAYLQTRSRMLSILWKMVIDRIESTNLLPNNYSPKDKKKLFDSMLNDIQTDTPIGRNYKNLFVSLLSPQKLQQAFQQAIQGTLSNPSARFISSGPEPDMRNFMQPTGMEEVDADDESFLNTT
jgi:hypothetical protein